MNTARSMLFACLAMLAAAISLSLPAQAVDIREVVTPKGVKAWLVEDKTIPLIAMNFAFRGGSAADPEGKDGLAHFLSGMLDEGAGDLDSAAFQQRVQAKSIKFSFDAGRDEFRGSLQTLSEHRDEAFDLLRLALTSPRFDQEPLERIRGQILLDVQQDSESPEDIASDAWMKTAFGSHPYGRKTKGSLEGLKAVEREDLKALVGRMFAKDGLLISVVGDIDEQTLVRLLDEAFGDLQDTSSMPQTPEAEAVRGPRIEVIKRDIPQSVIQFGLRGIKRDDPDFIAAYVMNFVLGDGGFGSRLTEEVREKRGLSYSVYTGLFPLERSGVIIGGAATVNDRAAETIEILRREIARMAEDGPTEKELAEAKTYITGSYALRFDSNRKISRQLLAIQRDRLGIDYVNQRNALIEAVTLEDVKRVARRLLDADGLVITVVGNPRDVVSNGRSG